jgi:hypothetical protein
MQQPAQELMVPLNHDGKAAHLTIPRKPIPPMLGAGSRREKLQSLQG